MLEQLMHSQPSEHCWLLLLQVHLNVVQPVIHLHPFIRSFTLSRTAWMFSVVSQTNVSSPFVLTLHSYWLMGCSTKCVLVCLIPHVNYPACTLPVKLEGLIWWYHLIFELYPVWYSLANVLQPCWMLFIHSQPGSANFLKCAAGEDVPNPEAFFLK